MDKKARKMTPEEDAILSELYKKYRSSIYLYVFSSIKDSQAADDIVSDTFTLACEKFDQFKSHPNQIGWLYCTARNKMQELYRKLQNNELPYTEDSNTSLAVDNSNYSLKEIEITIRGVLTPEEHRRFQRYFIWGYSLQEMADLEGISKDNMAVRLSRLRKKLMGKI